MKSYAYCTIQTGRAWLYLSLNEQATESYLRMFSEYQEQVAIYYNPWVDRDCLLYCYLCSYREAFLSDIEVCMYVCLHVCLCMYSVMWAYTCRHALRSVAIYSSYSWQRLLLLQTLITGLDFIYFDLSIVSDIRAEWQLWSIDYCNSGWQSWVVVNCDNDCIRKLLTMYHNSDRSTIAQL